MEPTMRRRGLLASYVLLIVAIMALTIVGTLLTLLLRPDHFVSSAGVVVRPEVVGGGTPLVPDMGTEREYATSGAVTKLAALRLGLTPTKAVSGLSVSVPVDSRVLEFSYSASTAQQAYRGAYAYANAYIAYRIAASGGSPPGTGGNGTRPNNPVPVVAMITPPTLPTAPAKPNYPVAFGLSLMVGAMLGAGCAYLWDRFSGKLRGVEDVASQTGAPVLGSVSVVRVSHPNEVAVLAQNFPPGAEAYGYLAARMLHLLESRGADTILVTSPTDGAGKTTTAANLAAALASTGKRTVLVSVDMHTPRVHERFDLECDPGLTDVLRGTTPLDMALHATTLSDLQVLTSGSEVAPGEPIFNVEDLSLVLQRLTTEDGLVVIDAPSVLGNPDTVLIADKVDLVLLVVNIRQGTRASVREAMGMLGHLDDAYVGAVANDPGRRPLKRSGRSRRSSGPLPLAPSEPQSDRGQRHGVPADRHGT